MGNKMNNLQSLVAVALCFIFVVCFSSCSKDDDKDEPDELETPIVKKRMKSVGEDDLITSFVYNEGKIVKSLGRYGRDEDSYIYTDSEIKVKSDYGTDIFYLNEDGLVTKIIRKGGHDYEEFTYEIGYIKTWKKYYNNALEEDISFEWKDGVIVSQIEYDAEILIDNSGNGYCSEHMDLWHEFNYTYTTYPDYGGAVAGFQSDSLFYDNLPEALIIQGYFGKWPKYLVTGVVDLVGNRNSDTYTYLLDGDGYPTTLMGFAGNYNIYFSWSTVK